MLQTEAVFVVLIVLMGNADTTEYSMKERPNALKRVQADIQNNTDEIKLLKEVMDEKQQELRVETKNLVEGSINNLKTSQNAIKDDTAAMKSSLNGALSDIEEMAANLNSCGNKIEKVKQECEANIGEVKEQIKSLGLCPTKAGYNYNSNVNMCYKLYRVSVTFDDADKVCKDDGGLLISLETQEKYNHIVSYLNGLGQKAYNPGLNRYQLWNGLMRVNYGSWIWPNGKKTLPRWAWNEPSNLSSRDCGQILSGGLGDIVCNSGRQPFMCEIPLN